MEGVLLGTAAYMSPEQARGRPVDKRTDVWAFGCVLYEMLTGRLAFAGETLSDTIATILQGEPDWRALPETTPVAIQRLLRRCLEKDPARRLRDIGDARIEIEDVLSGASPTPTAVVPAKRSVRLSWSIAAIASLVALIAVGALMSNLRTLRQAQNAASSANARVSRTTILLPGNLGNQTNSIGAPGARLALSPDGRRLAFVTTDANSRILLWVRPIDSLVAEPLSGTEGAASPFWSHDSRVLAFYAGGKLKKVDASGGPVTTICDAGFPGGGTWSRADVILFTSTATNAPDLVSIARVRATAGSTPVPVTTNNVNESAHLFPSFLPDGRHFLFVVRRQGVALGARIGELDSTEQTPLLDDASLVRYTQGFLVFSRGSSLMFQPFDPERLSPTGHETQAVDQNRARLWRWNRSVHHVRHRRPRLSRPNMGWRFRARVVRIGWAIASTLWAQLRSTRTSSSVRMGTAFRSPCRQGISRAAGTSGFWMREAWPHSSRSETATSRTRSGHPMEGGSSMSSRRESGGANLYEKSSDGASAEKVVLEDDSDKRPLSWSDDGFIIYLKRVHSVDLWALPLSGGRKAFAFLDTPSSEVPAQFSPKDGRWVSVPVDRIGGKRSVRRTLPKRRRPGEGLESRAVSTRGGTPMEKRFSISRATTTCSWRERSRLWAMVSFSAP